MLTMLFYVCLLFLTYIADLIQVIAIARVSRTSNPSFQFPGKVGLA